MILVAASLMLVEPEHFVVGDLRTSGDWTVGCDNSHACHATSMPEERHDEGGEGPLGDGSLSISIRSVAVPGTGPVVEFALLDPGEPVPGDPGPGLAIDNALLDIRPSGRDGLFRIEGADANIFVAAARTGRKVGLLDRNGAEIAAASLRGFSEALAFIDRQQYRTGTTGSLARPGPIAWDYRVVPASAPRAAIRVAARSFKPAVTPGADTLARLEALDPCGRSASDAEPAPPESYRLDADHSLLILPTRCGGYNPYRMLFVVDEAGTAEPARFWPYPGSPMTGDHELPDPVWDEDARRLRTFGRGRVLADCGEAAEYVWDRKAFRLVHFRSIYPCRGSHDYIITYDWPVVLTTEPGQTDRP